MIIFRFQYAMLHRIICSKGNLSEKTSRTQYIRGGLKGWRAGGKMNYGREETAAAGFLSCRGMIRLF